MRTSTISRQDTVTKNKAKTETPKYTQASKRAFVLDKNISTREGSPVTSAEGTVTTHQSWKQSDPTGMHSIRQQEVIGKCHDHSREPGMQGQRDITT